MLKRLERRPNKPVAVAIQRGRVLGGDCEGGWDDLERQILEVLGTYRQLRSDATTLAFGSGNAWKIEGPGMSSSNIGDLWHSRTPVDFGQILG